MRLRKEFTPMAVSIRVAWPKLIQHPLEFRPLARIARALFPKDFLIAGLLEDLQLQRC
jgi:hypothetical protein